MENNTGLKWEDFVKIWDNLDDILTALPKEPVGIGSMLILLISITFLFSINTKDHPKRRLTLLLFVTLSMMLVYFSIVFLNYKQRIMTAEEKLKEHITFDIRIPTIIGIYPNDHFGIDQKKGLITSVEESNFPIKIRHLDNFSIKELKNPEYVSRLLDSLQKILTTDNVVGIVGPSITECSDDILNYLVLENLKIPIFLSSAASSSFLDWKEKRKVINPYRIGSSISFRAEEFGRLLKSSSREGKVAMLVEKDFNGQRTFGELFYHELKLRSPGLSDLIHEEVIAKIYYDTNDTLNVSIDDAFKEAVNKHGAKFVFGLGVGNEIRFLIEKYYLDSKKMLIPKFGGWMHGYILNDLVAKSEFNRIIENKIFEISDLNTDRSFKSSEVNNFEKKFGLLHPGQRDIALTYDAGLILKKSIAKLYDRLSIQSSKEIKFCPKVRHYLSREIIDKSSHQGVIINQKFHDGENANIDLGFAIFNNSGWEPISMKEFWKI